MKLNIWMFKVEDVSCIHFICVGHNDYRLLRLFFSHIRCVWGRSREENGEYRCVEEEKNNMALS